MPRDPHTQATDIAVEEAYEYAAEEGYIRWLSATRIDPGCWSQDIDVEISEFKPMVDEDTGLPGGDEDFEARVTARFGKSIIFERDYRFYTNTEGYVSAESEDV